MTGAAAVKSVVLAFILVAAGCTAATPTGLDLPTVAPRVSDISLGDTSQTGDRTVSDTQTISGQVAGTLTVAKGGKVTLNGQVTNDLIVETGGQADVYGMVIGRVVNRGGRVTVYGQVGGVQDSNGGKTTLVSGAVVGGSPVP